MVLLAILKKGKKEQQEMEEDKMKRRISSVIAAFLAVATVASIFSTATIAIIQPAQAFVDPTTDLAQPKALMAASSDGGQCLHRMVD